MEEKSLLIDLEEPLRRLKCGIKALELMIYGLGHTNDPNADGFYSIWDCLQRAEEDIQKVVETAEG